MRFFIALRTFLARESIADLINAMAHDIIRRRFIPALELRLSRAKSENEREGLRELISLYEEYSSGRGARSQIFGNQVAKVVDNMGRVGNLPEEAKRDIATQFVHDTYDKKYWRKFRNIRQGPESFVKFLSDGMRMFFKWQARELMTKRKRQVSPTAPDDDDRGIEDVPGRQPPTPIEVMTEKEIRRGIAKAVKSRFRKPWQQAMFDVWMKALDREGSQFRFKRHVYPVIADEFGIPKNTMHSALKLMRRTIGDFFSKEFGLKAPQKFTGSDGMSILDSVTYHEYRRRVAAWFLSSICLSRPPAGV